MTKRGYIAMLAVDENFRKRKIGATLVKKAIEVILNSANILYGILYTMYTIFEKN